MSIGRRKRKTAIPPLKLLRQGLVFLLWVLDLVEVGHARVDHGG
jgi:hypothetical protein